MHTTQHPAYTAMVAEAERLGLPEIFKGDLYQWDNVRLHEPNAPTAFCWILRDNGTDLIAPSKGGYLWFMAVAAKDDPPADHYYLWDGHDLKEKEPEFIRRWLFNVLDASDQDELRRYFPKTVNRSLFREE
jgi:hypothetical protein